jgi:hypothetical protein
MLAVSPNCRLDFRFSFRIGLVISFSYSFSFSAAVVDPFTGSATFSYGASFKRGADEREFGRLKDYYGMTTIRVRCGALASP